MSKYVAILLWALAAVFLMPWAIRRRFELVNGEVEYRYSWIVAILVFLPLIYMSAKRGWIADTPLYIRNFTERMPSALSDIPSYINTVKKDKGFYFLSSIIKVIIGNHVELYLGIIAAIQSAGLIFLFRKYSPAFAVSFFLFIASTDYFSWMFNGIRQFTAVCMMLFATPFLLKRKFVPAILVILIASTMHRSALIMIPLVLISVGEAWNKRTLLFLAVVLLAVMFVGQFTNLLDDALQNTQYSYVVDDYTAWNDDGTNPLRVLVYSFPAIVSFWGRNKIKHYGDDMTHFCVNMSIASAGLYLISMVTSGLFMGRLPIYASLYSYILLPWEIDHLIDQKNRLLVYMSMIMAYVFLYYYQMHITWGRF